MRVIFIDADACPVKDEIYKVAKRYNLAVKVVANSTMRTPVDPSVEMIVHTGFGAVDDWIAENAGAGDIVVTADIPLAARSIEKGARVLDSKGHAITESTIGGKLATRDIMEERRQAGERTGGPSAMTPKDRSRFLSQLDTYCNAVLKSHPRKG